MSTERASGLAATRLRSGAPVAGAVSFHGRLVTHDPADVDAIAGPLLVLTGAADPVVPDDVVIAFENELRTAPALDWQIVSYSGAPHAFTLRPPRITGRKRMRAAGRR